MTDKIKAILAAVVLLLAVVGYFAWRQSERAIGAAQQATRQWQHVADSVRKVLPKERLVFQHDTLVLFRRIDRHDSLTSLNGSLDSARAALARVAGVRGVKPETVTVRVTAASVLEADSTIKACRPTISECGRLAASEKYRADALDSTVNALRRLQPSVFARCGVSAGYAVLYDPARKSGASGPAIVVGCRVFP